MDETYLKEKKILLVEDEKDMQEMLVSILKKENYNYIYTAHSMQSALTAFQTITPDIALFDIMLPDGEGFTLLKEVRAFSNIPVIFITAKDAIQDKYSGFDLGADDYITKPFLPTELLYRLHALLRRSYEKENPVLTLENCTVNLATAEVTKNNDILPLTAKEHAILDILSQHSNRIVTIDTICEHVWGEFPFGYENSLMTHIRRIREKIELDPSHPVSLITIKSLGYKLKKNRWFQCKVF